MRNVLLGKLIKLNTIDMKRGTINQDLQFGEKIKYYRLGIISNSLASENAEEGRVCYLATMKC